MSRSAALLAAALASSAAVAQLSPEEEQGLRDALMVANWTTSDLAFPRIAHAQAERMPVVGRALGDPVSASAEAMALHASSRAVPLSSLLRMAASLADEGRPKAPMPPTVPPTEPPAGLPAPLAAATARLVDALRAADAEIRAAASGLSPAELRELVEGLPPYAVEYPALRFEFVRSTPAPPARVRQLLAKVDVPRILAAGLRLAAEAEAGAKALAQAGDVPGKVALVVGGLPVVVAGKASDVHSERDARLTIDLGGDDVYSGRHGCGVGYSGLLIDLGGDDRYEVPDLSVGAGLVGVGLAYDLGGHDRLSGRTLCFGAGLAGMGGLFKAGGHDEYRSVALAQGFAIEGAGVLLDTDGDDRYSARLYAQGAARTRGVGWLADSRGGDTYRAGGMSLNSPLFANVHYSFSQGFGQGYREDSGGWSGGVGALTDHAGDDAYIGETYCQAASYWYAVGTLYDAEGNDSYTAHHYAQASAMHACGAYLFDLAGSDLYGVKFGAAQAIGHDYGVALLLDRKGDDVYAARDASPGTGTANGLGVFLESAGDDRYACMPGAGNPARGSGSLGLFVDLAGSDRYPSGPQDRSAQARPVWAVALDSGIPPAAPAPARTPSVGSKARPSDSELEALYAKATQWGVGTAQSEVEAAVFELCEVGLPAVQWMAGTKLATMGRLERRCIAAVARAVGEPAALPLAQAALGGGAAVKRAAVQVAVDAGLQDLGALLPGMLEDPETQAVAAQAAGPLRATATVPLLHRLVLSPDPMLARAAAVSLSQIASPDSAGTAQALLRSADPLVREAALDLIAKLPGEGAVVARALTGDGDEARTRQGVAILGRIGDSESLRMAGQFLLDPRPGVRIEALRQLDRRCPPELRPTFLSLRDDPVALVRFVAAGVRPEP
jgi:hypothetical protein